MSGMEKKEIKSVVGVRFNDVGKIYHFNASGIDDLTLNDPVIVETSRGCQIGFIALFADPETIEDIAGIKPIERKATPQDLILHQSWIQKEDQAVSYIRQKAVEMKFNNIKIIAAEYSFDGKKLTVSFSAESDEKVDLKRLRQAVTRKFSPTQVDIRQIGPRDVAKQIGGMGACGLDKRCCCKFLTEFSSISIRMAKEQNISLTPTEITGICGRLRCCLIYEYDQYVVSRKKLPKKNKIVKTPVGDCRVIDVCPLKESVIVETPDNLRKEFPLDQIQFE